MTDRVLTIARHLDDFGVGFIEGGWPGANPRDTEFFQRVQEEVPFRHVEPALRTTLDENLAMIRDTVAYLRAQGRRIFLDCEHFFDGYALDALDWPQCERGGTTGGVARRAFRATPPVPSTASRLPAPAPRAPLRREQGGFPRRSRPR